jgi:hypothetical protein
VAYLGNDLQVAFPTYRNIDDISGSFNGVTTSFPLAVAGVAPIPAPVNSQQCLISVNGVVQRPDDSGTEGFRLNGGNIIFAAAPASGVDFFGVILAGADYINVGANFPSGTNLAPSITFDSDLDTGIYNPAGNHIGFTTAGVQRVVINSSGQLSGGLGSASAPAVSFISDPNTGIYSPGADQVAISTNGTGRLFVGSTGNVGVGTASPGGKLVISDGSTTFQFDPVGGTGNILRSLTSGGSRDALLFDASQYVYTNGATEYARIDSSGRLLVGTSSTLSNTTALLQGYGGVATGPAHLRLARGSNSPASGDNLGLVLFSDSEHTNCAFISADRDGGTWSASSKPTRLVFSTTADGASSPTERMRIGQSGTVTINGPGGGSFLVLSNSGGYSGRHELDNTAYTIGQNSDLRALRIGSGANWLTTGVNLAAGGTSWGTYSDERLKEDIVELNGCLEQLSGIRCVTYRLRNIDDADSKKRLGVIAQDLEGKFDEALNASRRSEDDENEYLSVQYADLVPVLIKSLQEAKGRIETLEAKVAALEGV